MTVGVGLSDLVGRTQPIILVARSVAFLDLSVGEMDMLVLPFG